MERDPLPRWRDDFAKLRGDINNILCGAHVYDLMDHCLATNPSVLQGDPVLTYIDLWYYQAMVAGIRRHVKDSPQSHTLIHILKQIAARPEVLSIEASQVNQAIVALQDATAKCEHYADRTVAHFDKRGVTQLPIVREFKDAIRVLGEVFGTYQQLVCGVDPINPAVALAPHWTNALDVPWRNSSGAA